MNLIQKLTDFFELILADINQVAHWPVVKNVIDEGETVTIPEHHQLIVANQLKNSGTIINNGTLYIL